MIQFHNLRRLLLLVMLFGAVQAKATFFYFTSASVLTPVVTYFQAQVHVSASLSDPCVTVDSADMVRVNNKILLVLHVSESNCLSGGGCIAVITPYAANLSVCPPAGLDGTFGFGLVINEYCPSVFPMTTDTISTTDSIEIHNVHALNLSACDSLLYNGTVYHNSTNTVIPYLSAAGCDSSLQLHVSIQSPDTSVSQAGPVLTSNATGAAYQWINCNGHLPIPGATGVSYTATQNGTYAVVVTKNGCSDTSACKTVSGLGIDAPLQGFPFLCYPNPLPRHEQLHVQIPQDMHSIEFMDLSGRMIRKQEDLHPGTMLFSMPEEAGCYLLRITLKNGSRYLTRILIAG